MLEPLHKLPQGTVERSRHAGLFAQVRDCPVHEVHFGLASCKNVLQHAGIVFTGRVRTFLHQGARITMQLNPQRFGYRFTFCDLGVEQRAGRRESGRCAVVQEGQRANWIRRSIEN